MVPSISDDSLKRAHATLLVLQTILALPAVEGQGLKRYIVTPDLSPTTAELAAVALSKIAKPVSCTAIKDGEYLKIECKRFATSEEILRHRTLERDYRPLVNDLIQSLGRGGVNPLILLQGMGQPIPMSASEILAWLEDYDFDAMGLGFAWDGADDEADKAGAVGTLTFSGPIGYSSFRSR